MWWVVFFLGAVFTLTPGVLNPMAPINGATLLGVGLLAWSSTKLLKDRESND